MIEAGVLRKGGRSSWKLDFGGWVLWGREGVIRFMLQKIHSGF